MKRSLFILLIAFFFSSCAQKNEDIVKEPNKEGSIETLVHIKHEQNFDVLTTIHKVWVKNKLDKTLITRDTLASLGNAILESKDENGNLKKVVAPKDYEFYITVK